MQFPTPIASTVPNGYRIFSRSSQDIFDSDDEHMSFEEWDLTDWVGKECVFSRIKQDAEEQADEPLGDIVYRCNILTSHVCNHTDRQNRVCRRRNGYISLNTGITWRIEPGIVGQLRLRPYYRRVGLFLLNRDLTHYDSRFTYELYVCTRYIENPRIKPKARNIFAEVIFNKPVKITEMIEDYEGGLYHVVSVVAEI